ncbi:hypothetical protein VAL01S_05_00660 [Vibrio alginolyticus NBRC 15630 = ATCC 17749]|nr:hypothetical protein HLBS07_01620 [Vibrio alginolyticus]GAD70488.1 hypothetical protein VAL01S_05_00660 [Vibrio alginolyticus NBRC 15630 = ATCC 17749]
MIPPNKFELTKYGFDIKLISEQFTGKISFSRFNYPLKNHRQDKSLKFIRNTKYGVLLKFNLDS